MKPPVVPIGIESLYDSLIACKHEVGFFDFGVSSQSELLDFVIKFNPDVIGITLRNMCDGVMFDQIEFITPLAELIETIRTVTKSKIVLGGSGFSVMPLEIVEATKADLGVVGAGEITLVKLLENLNAPYLVPNVVYKDPQMGKYKISHEERSSLKQLPLCSRSLVDHEKYCSSQQMNNFNIETCRGCNLKCIFCPEPEVKGRQVIFKSPGLVVEELTILKNKGVDKEIFVVDSEFNLSNKHAYDVCKAIVESGVKVSWSCTVTPQGITAELLRIMKLAGCTNFQLCIDSLSETMLQNYEKQFTVSDVERVTCLAKQEGLPCIHVILLGGPGETIDTINETHRNLESLNPHASAVSTGIRIYPQTKLFQMAMDEGEIKSASNVLYPVYYQESYVRKVLFPHVQKVFSSVENCLVLSPNQLRAFVPQDTMIKKSVDIFDMHLGVSA